MEKEVARKNDLETYTYNQFAMYSVKMSLSHVMGGIICSVRV